MLSELRKKPAEVSMSQEETDLLRELSVRLDWAGISDPLNKAYVKPPNINEVVLVLFLLSVSCLHKMHYCKNTGK